MAAERPLGPEPIIVALGIRSIRCIQLATGKYCVNIDIAYEKRQAHLQLFIRFADGLSNHLIARWLFLRALGLIYFSAFFSLLFQVRGLIGTQGILPAADYLLSARGVGTLRLWYIPSLLWLSSSDHMLMGICWAGLIVSLLVVANIWPRLSVFVCFLCFLSLVSAAQDFSGYQSDGMLLEAGFLSLFLALLRTLSGFAAKRPPIRAAIFLLLWEWFRIYFESGVVKLRSGDPTWRNLTAMYEYYQNGPLPTWIGWYLQHLPHWFHIATGNPHSRDGTRPRLAGLSSTTLANHLLLHRHDLASGSHRHRELRIPQLPRPHTRVPLARRHIPATLRPSTLAKWPQSTPSIWHH